jgi:electron transfer flavoprotein alpha subunit
VLAVIPVRDGVLPAGGAETAAECHGNVLLIGDDVAIAALSIPGTVRLAEAGAYRPGTWAAALAPLLDEEPVIVLPSSPDGRDLAPRLAAALDREYLAGAMQISPDNVVLARDGGVHLHTVTPPAAFVATLEVGVRGVEPSNHSAHLSTVQLDLGADHADAVLAHVLEPDAATIDLAEAPRIVGGGAGLDGPTRFGQLAQLGEVLGASVGATRVITDRGWVGHERQIGTTGVVVDPQLYLAFGISGAVQHTSGLGQPDHIVSVNVDPHCPMMQLADLAVVGDANAILDALVILLGTQSTIEDVVGGETIGA